MIYFGCEIKEPVKLHGELLPVVALRCFFHLGKCFVLPPFRSERPDRSLVSANLAISSEKAEGARLILLARVIAVLTSDHVQGYPTFPRKKDASAGVTRSQRPFSMPVQFFG